MQIGVCTVERAGVRDRPETDGCGRARRVARLLGGIRAQEELGSAVSGVVGRSRDDRRPDREADGATLLVSEPRVRELHPRNRRLIRGELVLGQHVDLRADEPVREERILVRRDVEAVAIGADVRVVADACVRLRLARREDSDPARNDD